jgi:hypothetical protein
MNPVRNLTFKSILWLDDMRMPLIFDIDWVKNYDQFVWHLQNKPMPELVCFDHDLHISHYPISENKPGMHIPYETYKEKTGLHAARFIIENKLPLRYWSTHTFNAQGKINIQTELRRYCPQGELQDLKIPYRIQE